MHYVKTEDKTIDMCVCKSYGVGVNMQIQWSQKSTG